MNLIESAIVAAARRNMTKSQFAEVVHQYEAGVKDKLFEDAALTFFGFAKGYAIGKGWDI